MNNLVEFLESLVRKYNISELFFCVKVLYVKIVKKVTNDSILIQ